MGADGERTPGEIARALDSLTEEVRGFRAEITQSYVRKDVYEAEKSNHLTRLTVVENRQEWVMRTIGALIFAAIIGGLLASRPG